MTSGTAADIAVTDATNRADGRVLIAPAELAAEPGPGELHPRRPDAGRIVPDLGEQLFGRKHRTRVPGEGVQQPVLDVRQIDVPMSPGRAHLDTTCPGVDPDLSVVVALIPLLDTTLPSRAP